MWETVQRQFWKLFESPALYHPVMVTIMFLLVVFLLLVAVIHIISHDK